MRLDRRHIVLTLVLQAALIVAVMGMFGGVALVVLP